MMLDTKIVGTTIDDRGKQRESSRDEASAALNRRRVRQHVRVDHGERPAQTEADAGTNAGS